MQDFRFFSRLLSLGLAMLCLTGCETSSSATANPTFAALSAFFGGEVDFSPGGGPVGPVGPGTGGFVIFNPTIQAATLSSITVLPEIANIGVGDEFFLIVTGQLSDGTTVAIAEGPGVDVTFTSNAPAVASVDENTGRVDGLGVGVANMTVQVVSDGVTLSDTSTVNVTAVTPARMLSSVLTDAATNPLVLEADTDVTVQVIGVFDNGDVEPLTEPPASLTFSSTLPAIAAVTDAVSAGVVTGFQISALANGTTNVNFSATVDGVTASGTLQVEVFSRFFISLVPTAAGVAGNGLSQKPAVSADGGVVAFESASSDLVPGDTLGLLDIFVEQSGTIERVSLAFDGSEPDFECIKPDISAAGTRVIFQTESALSDPGIDLDDNGESDIYLVDRTGPSIERVSLSALGGQLGVGATEGAISANGQFVTFSSGERLLPLTPGVGPLQVYRKNLTTGAVDLVSGFEITPGVTLPADFDCTQSAVSADGRFVVFVSASTVFDSLTNPNGDVFIKDMNTPLAAPVRVSLPGSGIPTGQISRFPSVSADGNFVAFESFGSFVAADLDGSSDIYVWNRVADTFVQASVTSTGAQVTGDSAWASLSGDGRFVAFSCLDDLTPDAGPEEDVYVRDLSGTADAIQLASKSPAGAPGDEVSSGPLDLSDDGNHVVFQSLASNLGQLGNVSGDLFKATNPVLFPVLP